MVIIRTIFVNMKVSLIKTEEIYDENNDYKLLRFKCADIHLT